MSEGIDPQLGDTILDPVIAPDPLDEVTEVPTIEEPDSVSKLAAEQEAQAMAGLTIVPRLVEARRLIAEAVPPLKWLGFDPEAEAMSRIYKEITDLLR